MTIEELSNEPAEETIIENNDDGAQSTENNEPSNVETTSREAVARAFEKLDLGEDDEGQETAKAEEKTPAAKPEDKARAEVKPDGEKEPAPKKGPVDDKESFVDAPARFSADAKSAWKDAPLPVRAEIDRAVKELESGIEGYKSRVEKIEPFEKLAKENNVDLAEQMQTYVNIDQLLAKDFLGGLTEICKNRNVDLRDVAAHVLNQPVQPKQDNPAESAIIQQLQSKIDALEGQLTGVTTSIKDDHMAKLNSEIDAFAADKPRFDELADDIVLFLDTKKAGTLEEAYTLAERLNPAPQGSTQGDPVPKPRAAQTRKEQYSLSGAPARGSNPTKRKTPETSRDALDAAFDKLGL